MSDQEPNYDGELDFLIYGYVPSMAAAITFTVLFALITAVQLGYVLKSRSWWLIVLLLGGVGEIIGWAGGRLWSSQSVYKLNPFLIQICTLILAPCFYSATLYASLGLMIRSLDPLNQHTVIKPRNYVVLFCAADLVAIIVQAVGGGMAATALQENESSAKGTHTMVAGVSIQLAAMVAFCILAVIFWWRVRKDPELGHRMNGRKTVWLSWALVWASFWILLRCVYRVVELAEGWTGYLITHEPYFWALDSIPMVLTQAVFLVTWPTWCLSPPTQTIVHKTALSPTETIVGGDVEAGHGADKTVKAG
ncbi:hypothetical protein ACM66B_002867 [Microbotryomycetes sp. NB124-2]